MSSGRAGCTCHEPNSMQARSVVTDALHIKQTSSRRIFGRVHSSEILFRRCWFSQRDDWQEYFLLISEKQPEFSLGNSKEASICSGLPQLPLFHACQALGHHDLLRSIAGQFMQYVPCYCRLPALRGQQQKKKKLSRTTCASRIARPTEYSIAPHRMIL